MLSSSVHGSSQVGAIKRYTLEARASIKLISTSISIYTSFPTVLSSSITDLVERLRYTINNYVIISHPANPQQVPIHHADVTSLTLCVL